jgi:hypothetical protein
MQALAQAHLHNHKLTIRELLRTAYMWRFSRDITEMALTNDAKVFSEQGHSPDYLVKYLLGIYGAQ